MPEPVAVGEILGALELGTKDDTAEQFLETWNQALAEDGRPSPLPVGWRGQVREMVDLGLPVELVEVCAAVGASNYEVRPAKRFAYAVATGRRTVERQRAAAALSAAHWDEGTQDRELVLNTQGSIVHTPQCSALEATSILNLVSVTHVAPFRACQKCRP